MTQVNKYADRAAYAADTERLATKSAVSLIESESATLYDGVNVLVEKPAAAVGDLAVFDPTDGKIKYLKSATIDKSLIPPHLTPLAVVYARQGERLLVVSLENAVGGSQRWAAPYEVALSDFDLAAGGTFVMRFGTGANTTDVPVTYPAGASLADVAAAADTAMKAAAHDFTYVNYGGWEAAAGDACVILSSNTFMASWAAIDVVEGCTIRRTSEDRNYQTTLTGVLIDGSVEYIRRNNGVDSRLAGCNPEKFLQYALFAGVVKTGLKPGSADIIRESVFTEEDNPELVAAYPTYRDYLFGEHMIQYPGAYGAVVRDGRANTEKIGRLRFTDIRGQRVPCYPAASAALEYGVTVEGAVTGLEPGAWWMPSVEEIYLLMRDRVLTGADRERDPVNRTLSRLGKTTCYGNGYYPFTSCEYFSYIVFLYNGSAGYVGDIAKYGAYAVRPVSIL